MLLTQGFEPRPHWWEDSAVITAAPLVDKTPQYECERFYVLFLLHYLLDYCFKYFRLSSLPPEGFIKTIKGVIHPISKHFVAHRFFYLWLKICLVIG